MAYWLMKSEPDAWSWDQQVTPGAKGEPGPGVRNHRAKLNLMKMKNGDRAFFYHSDDRQGSRRHCRGDPRALSRSDRRKRRSWVVVDVKAVKPLPKPVTLDAIKAEPKLKAMVLVNNSRLSVQPVTAEEWKLVCKMGGLETDTCVIAGHSQSKTGANALMSRQSIRHGPFGDAITRVKLRACQARKPTPLGAPQALAPTKVGLCAPCRVARRPSHNGAKQSRNRAGSRRPTGRRLNVRKDL